MSIKPIALIDEDEMQHLISKSSAIVNPLGVGMTEEGCTMLYAIPDTHRVVSVEDLKDLEDTMGFWINSADTRSMSEQEYKTWLALGYQSKTATRLRAIIYNK